MDPEPHFWSTSILSVLLDFGVWLVPVPGVVMGLKVRGKGEAIGLGLVGGLGGV